MVHCHTAGELCDVDQHVQVVKCLKTLSSKDLKFTVVRSDLQLPEGLGAGAIINDTNNGDLRLS